MSSLDHIDVDGVSFAKASFLAKEFKYTQDYIGQLCRAKKVNARLVGRTWYVDPASLQVHKDGRYAELRSGTTRPSIKSDSNKKQRLKIEPRRDKRHLKLEKSGEPTLGAKNFYDRLEARPLRYTTDASDLIPLVSIQDAVTEEISVDLPLEQAGAVNIPIQGSDAHLTKLRSEPLPSVVLEGDLDVEEVPENIQQSEEEKHENVHKNNVISTNNDLAPEKEVEEEEVVKRGPIKAPKSKQIKIELTEKLDSEAIAKEQAKTEPVPVASDELDRKTSDSRNFIANEFISRVNTVAETDQMRPVKPATTIEVTKLVSETPSTLSLFKYAPAAALLALIAGGAVLSLDMVSSVGDGFLTTQLDFNFASLQEIFQ